LGTLLFAKSRLNKTGSYFIQKEKSQETFIDFHEDEAKKIKLHPAS
jgi:hypothetical protein